MVLYAAAAIMVLAHQAAALPPGSVTECFVMARLDGPERLVNQAECDRQSAPASTFKIPHALIALQTGIVDSRTVMKWDGTPRDFPSWNRDHSLDSAIKSSVFWFFERTAAAIGRDRMLEQLRAFHHGSEAFHGDLTTFWVNGDLVISPHQQIAFLRRMFSYQLPIDRANVDVVKSALTMPAGHISNAAGTHDFPLRWPPGTIVRAKTGNTTVAGERVSWLVGELETAEAAYVFAARVRSRTRALDTTAGAQLALRSLNARASL